MLSYFMFLPLLTRLFPARRDQLRALHAHFGQLEESVVGTGAGAGGDGGDGAHHDVRSSAAAAHGLHGEHSADADASTMTLNKSRISRRRRG